MTSTRRRSAPIVLVALLAVIGIIFIDISIIYFAEPAKSLPAFFPGHQTGSDHHRTTHGVAALIGGLAALVGAWMGGGSTG